MNIIKIKSLVAIRKNTLSHFKIITGIINLFKCLSSDKFNNLLKLADDIEDVKVNENKDVMIVFKNSFILFEYVDKNISNTQKCNYHKNHKTTS